MSGYYSKKTPKIDFYGTTTSGSTEPNMRQEMINTLEGSFPEIAKGRYFILRRMRRDDNGDMIDCDCLDPVTNEPDKSKFCPICFGLGKLFDEEYILAYRKLLDTSFSSIRRHNIFEPGNIDAPFVAFYFISEAHIKHEDRIIEVEMNDDGTVATPVTYVNQYRIDKAWDYRSDNGKLEYWKVYTHEEVVKFLTAPSFGE